jgi:uncharacterized protein (DUF362 family)/Pyruvate/2-oxoacid:ferredoxin oxidoreductase delta subunit
MNSKVGIQRCGGYEREELYRALKAASDLAGGPEVAGKTVLLKPNIVFDSSPEKAIVTHPVFLEACIRLVRERGAARILVGDSPGLQTPGFQARLSGLGETAEKNGAQWQDFTRGRAAFPCPEGRVMKQFSLAEAAREADCIISLPKLKTHQFMNFSGAMKNLFGLVPSVVKSSFHVRFPSRESFAAMITDLNLALKPHYAFMDAVTGMEGPGPSAGTPRHIGLVLASPNLLALDAAACLVIGYPPGEIPISREALARGVWLKDFSEIEYPGLSPGEVKIPGFVKVPLKKSGNQLLDFMLPRRLRRFREALVPRPEIRRDICVRCGDCARICASGAVATAGEGQEKQMVISYEKCIRCYCCHEICPLKAIDIKKVKITEVLGG